ncbi:hypothetical protein [Streptomyces sp. NPDC017991]|uniref:hypothetical protein n=1 Tax=Streptomyces sp. NPDC017991 TaxID=3365026 RepID=UPI003798A1A8
MMEILRRLLQPRLLPPTKDGYQAPVGALADGWTCDDPSCGGGEFFDPAKAAIPRRCASCGSGTYPVPAWPWWHGARRAELDALSDQAGQEGDEVLGTLVDFHLLTWTFENHLMLGHRRDALVSLQETDVRLRTAMREDRFFTEGSYRLELVRGALRSGDPDTALRVIEPWVALAREEGAGYGTDLKSDNAARTNYRCLVAACLAWTEDARTSNHGRRTTLVTWTLDTAGAHHVRDWLTGPQDAALDALEPGRRGRR